MGGVVEAALNDIHYVEALYHVPGQGGAGAIVPSGPARFMTLEACKYAAVDDVGLAFRG